MTALGGFAKPGMGAATMTSEREIVPQGFDQKALFKSVVVSGAARDAGNTPPTILRPGLLLGKLDSGSEYEEWDADAADGTQNIGAILWKELRAQDFDANNTDRVFTALVGGCPLIASQLLIQGSSLVGHVDEYLARRQLASAGFVLDDDPFGYKAGRGSRVAQVTGTTDALTADENGTTLFYNNSGSVTVTLPTIKPGLEYTLIRNGDEEFVVTSAEGDNIIGINDLSVDSITFTTATEHLGAAVRVRSLYMGTTLKWLLELVYTAHDAGGTVPATYSVAS